MTGRFLIVGAGALGGLLAAQWTLAGVPAVLVARGPALAAIARHGVRVRRPFIDEAVTVEALATIAEARPAPGDIVVLAVKAQHAEATIADIAWRPLAGGGTVADLPVVTLQNGLATEDLALRRFGRVVGVSVGIAASHLEPGVVVSPSWPVVGLAWVGAHPTTAPDLERRIAEGLARAGFEVSVVPDIGAAKRRKLLGNLRNVVEVFAHTTVELDTAVAELQAEACEVFDAHGLAVAPLDPGARLDIGEVPGHVPGQLSTWQSLARGASVEGDYLSGEIVLLARRAGIPAPRNEAVQRALGALAERGGRPGEVALSAVLPDLLAKGRP